MNLGDALHRCIFPDGQEVLERARQRLCFDEFLCLQLGCCASGACGARSRAGRWPCHGSDLETLIAGLPFTLTSAQNKALRDILADLEQPCP